MKQHRTNSSRLGALTAAGIFILLAAFSPQGAQADQQPYINIVNNCGQLNTYYQGDSIGGSGWNVYMNINQTSWSSMQVGIGFGTSGLNDSFYGMVYNSGPDGGGNDYCVGTIPSSYQFTQVGNYYLIFQAAINSGTYTTGGSCSGYVNTTQYPPATMNIYFTANALNSPSGQSATKVSPTQINLAWTRGTSGNAKNTVILRNTTGTFTDPTQGTAYSLGNTIGSGGSAATVVYATASGTSFSDTGLTSGTTYYYKFYSENFSYYSPGVTASVTAGPADEYWRTDGTTGGTWTSTYWNIGSANTTGGTGWTSANNAVFTANSTLTFASSTIGNVTVSAGANTVTVTAGGTLTLGGVRTFDIGSGATLTWTGQTQSSAAPNEGAGIIKNSAGTLSLGAISSNARYDGGFTLNAGTVIVSGANSFGTGVMTINGGTVQSSGSTFTSSSMTIGGDFSLAGTGSDVWTQAVNIGASTRSIANNTTGSATRTFSGIISGGTGAGLTFTGTGGSGGIVLSGVNTYSGPTTISGGLLQIGDGTTDGSISSSSSITDNAALTYNLVGSQTYANVIGGSGTLTKSGAGSLTLTANNTYGGGTTVGGGTLRINGQTSPNSGTGSGTVTVNAGGSLSGNGRVSGAVTVASSASAALYPNSSATLTIGGNLTFGTSSLVKFDLSSSASGANDKVVLENKTLAFGTSTKITINSAGTLDTNDYVLLDAGGSGSITGTFNSSPQFVGTTPKYAAGYSIVKSGTQILLRYTQIPITVTATINSKTYDGTTSATATPTVTSGTLATGDAGNFTETYANKDAASGSKTLNPAGTIVDTVDGNADVTVKYNINFNHVTTGTVTPKTLNYTITAANKVYDATTTASLPGGATKLTAESPGAGSTSDGAPYTGDTVNISGTPTGTFASKDVANGIAVAVSGLSLAGGGQSADYSLGSPSSALSANITAKSLNYSSLSAANKTYDATTTASFTGSAAALTAESPGSGSTSDGTPYTGDIVSFTGTPSGTFASKNVASGIAVTVTGGLSLSGAQLADYSVGSPSTALSANITAKSLNYSGLSAVSKIYNATTTASFTGTATPQSAESPGSGSTSDGLPYTGDTVSFTGAPTGTFASKDVANGIAVTVTGGLSPAGAQSADYTVGSPSSALSANITAKPLNYTGISAANKPYDTTTTATLSGTAAALTPEAPGTGSTSDGTPYTGDMVSFSTSTLTGTFASPNVGNAIPVTLTGGVSLTGAQHADYSVGSPSPALSANIVKATTALALTPSANPALPGASVIFTASLTVTAPGGGTPTGNVIFQDGATSFYTNALDGSDDAYATNGTLSHGSHTISAEFAGDANYLGITNTLDEVIDQPPTVGAFTVGTVVNTAVSFTETKLLKASSDPDADELSVSSVDGTSANGGTITDLSGTITYTPDAGFIGTDTFDYVVSDSLSDTTSGTVTVDVRAGNYSTHIASVTMLEGGAVEFRASGVPDHTYGVQATTSLDSPDWEQIDTVTAADNGLIDYVDENAGDFDTRYYRLAQNVDVE